MDVGGAERLLALALDGARRPARVIGLIERDDPADQPDDAGSEEPVRTLVLVAQDAADLSDRVRLLPDPGGARTIAVVLVRRDPAEGVVGLRAHPMWPVVTDLDAQLVDGGAVTRVELPRRTPALPLLVALARAATDPHGPPPSAHRGLRIGPHYAPDDEIPIDVVVGGRAPTEPSEVTLRVPLWVPDDELAGATPAEQTRRRAALAERAGVRWEP